MALLVRCGACGTEFRSHAKHRGKATRCAHCGGPLVVDGPAIPDHDVFISYSSSDKHVADAICAALEAKRWRCWIAPRDVLPGSDWGAAIIEAIEQSRLMVLVYTANANRSQQVLREIERAVSKGLAVIPFRVEAAPPSKNMEYFLSTSHWMDALTTPLERHIEALADSVKRLLATRAAGEPPAAPAVAGAPLQSAPAAVMPNPGVPAEPTIADPAQPGREPNARRRRVLTAAVLAVAAAGAVVAVLATRAPRANGSLATSQPTTRTTTKEPAATSRPATAPAASQPADAITERTVLVSSRMFKLRRRFPEVRFPITVPPIASGSGTLEISLWNMGDNAGDKGMYCVLLNDRGEPVMKWFDHRFRVFKHQVASGSSWTVVLEDYDAGRDGNGGGVEVAVVPN